MAATDVERLAADAIADSAAEASARSDPIKSALPEHPFALLPAHTIGGVPRSGAFLTAFGAGTVRLDVTFPRACATTLAR
jgi:hypothetical protein